MPEGKICHIFNATAESELVVDSPSEFYAETFNALGESVGKGRKYPAGLTKIVVPISGCAKLQPIGADDA